MYMENFINNLKKLIIYPKRNKHSFILPEASCRSDENINSINNLENAPVYTNISKNIDYLKVQYNAIINSDIIMREFNIKIFDATYKCLFLGIDGMVDSELINNYLLKPLMNLNCKKIKHSSKEKSEISLEDFLYEQLIPQNSIKKIKNMYEIIHAVNLGNCALFVDTLDVAFSIDVKGYPSRSITTPNNEVVVRGAQEAFVEKLRTNTSMLRRIINSENLVIETSTVGKISKTDVAICYMKNIVNDDLVSEVKYRINQLSVDYIISSGQLEQLIQDNSNISAPQMIATERPDKASNHLLEGRVVILINGSPYSLIVPGVFIDFLSSPEDFNLKHQYANLLRIIRLIAAFITLLLPGIYVAITTYHVELIPTELLFTIASARNTVPFPVIFEILLMEVSFELIREAGLRIPTPVGPTIGIIGALILGDAAVKANLVSPILIIIVAITGICSFSIPDFSLSFTFRIYKFIYIFLGYAFGFFGIAAGLAILCGIFANLKSFGVYYLSPFAPVINLKSKISYFLHPIWQREFRADFLNTKRPVSEEHISMKWKFGGK